MTTPHGDRLRQLFEAALSHPVELREQFLADACPDDPQLVAEIVSLLEHDELAPPGFLLFRDGHRRRPILQADSPDPLIGTCIGKYLLREVIAAGGMGTVYKAEQEHPHRTVAVKVMHAGAWPNSARRRFEFEAQALARLTHPHIIQIFDAGLWGADSSRPGSPYFAVEYVPNARSITEFSHERKLDTRDRVALMVQVCEAVHYGHQKGIIHRDLKPANILVDPTEQVKVVDFGVARAIDADVMATTARTDVGELVGTLHYMSPEQCEGDAHAIDVRSDVYSLGVVLFQVLTGQLPYAFSGTSIYNATRVIREQSPTRPSSIVPALRGDLETIVLKALQKDRAYRYQSMAEFAEDLKRYLRHEPILARRPSAVHQLHLFVRRHRGFSIAVVALVAVLIVATVSSTRFAIRESRERARGQRREYALSLAAAHASIQRYDVADARARLEQASAMPLGNNGESWELAYLRSLLDQSISSVRTGDSVVNGIAVNSSGELIAASIQGRPEVQLWRVEDIDGLPTISRDPIASARFEGEKIQTLAMGRAGEWLAVGTNTGMIHLVDLRSPRAPVRLGDLRTSLHEITALSVETSGTRIAACDGGGVLEVWNTATPNQSTRLIACNDFPVISAGFSASGRFLALGGMDSVVRVLDLESANGCTEPVVELHGHTDKVTGVAFRPDDAMLASSSLDGTVRLWRVEQITGDRGGVSRTVTSVTPDILYGYEDGITAVAFAPDGNMLAMGCPDNSVRLWEVDDHGTRSGQLQPGSSITVPIRRELARLRGHEQGISALAFGPNGEWVASASADGWIRIFAAAEQTVVPTLEGHMSSVWAAAFHPSGDRLMSGAADSAISIWDVRAAEGVKAFYAHDGVIRALSLSDDGAFLASADEEGTLNVWTIGKDPDVLKQAARLQVGQGGIFAVAWSANHRRLAAGGDNGSVRVWSIEDPANPVLQFEARPTEVPTAALAFLDQSGEFLAVGAGSEQTAVDRRGSLAVLDNRDGTETTQLPGFEAGVLALALSPDGTQLAVGAGDGSVHMWDVRNPRSPKQSWIRESHTAIVYGLAFHPDGTRLASGSSDRTTRIWDVQAGDELLVLRGHTGQVLSLCFSPDGRTLATTSAGVLGRDNAVKLWDAQGDAFEARRRRWMRSQTLIARRQAEPFVDTLFAEMFCKDSVLSHLRQTDILEPPAQAAAVRLAESHIETRAMWQSAWSLVRSSSATREDCGRALQDADCHISQLPEQFVGVELLQLTKGLALYRLGRHSEATILLQAAIPRLDSRGRDPRFTSDIPYAMAARAILAMCLFRNHQPESAQRVLQQVVDWSADPAGQVPLEVELIIGEAISLVSS